MEPMGWGLYTLNTWIVMTVLEREILHQTANQIQQTFANNHGFPWICERP